MDKDIINIKGTRNGLVICLDSEHDFEEIKKTLKFKIEAARGFFKGAKFVFHLNSPHVLPVEQTKELEDICCTNGLIPDHGITWPARETPEQTPAPSNHYTPKETPAANIRPLVRDNSPSLPSLGVTSNDDKRSLLIYRSLRSGQKINFDGNVVVMGDVNPGSEITAAGDIVVMGSLRGLVHAGAKGSEEAIIMAYRLNPVQLRIGSTISRPPENSSVSSSPEIARLQKGQMIIEPYMTHGLK